MVGVEIAFKSVAAKNYFALVLADMCILVLKHHEVVLDRSVRHLNIEINERVITFSACSGEHLIERKVDADLDTVLSIAVKIPPLKAAFIAVVSLAFFPYFNAITEMLRISAAFPVMHTTKVSFQAPSRYWRTTRNFCVLWPQILCCGRSQE